MHVLVYLHGIKPQSNLSLLFVSFYNNNIIRLGEGKVKAWSDFLEPVIL